MTLDWTDFEVVAAGVATGSIPILLTYLFNERSARSQLEREQEYGRRREQYERILSALRRKRDLIEAYQGFLRFQAVVARQAESPSTAPGQGPTNGGLPEEAVSLISKLFAILGDLLTEAEAPSIAPRELLSTKAEDRREVVGIVIDSTIRGFGRANEVVESALTSLQLVDADEDFIGRAASLSNKLVVEVSEGPEDFLKREYDWKGINSELGDLELIALQDLKSVLGKTIDVELSRARPLRSVEAKKRRAIPRSGASEP